MKKKEALGTSRHCPRGLPQLGGASVLASLKPVVAGKLHLLFDARRLARTLAPPGWEVAFWGSARMHPDRFRSGRLGWLLLCLALVAGAVTGAPAGDSAAPETIDRATLDQWSAPYRGWHYWPGHVIPAQPKIPGHEAFHNTDVPCVYQLPGQPGKWFMSFIAFNGQGYNSFVAESTNLVHWANPRLAMGFGPANEFDHGGCVVGAFLYDSYDLRAPRLLKQRDGQYWTLYGCYPRQGGYELRPGYDAEFCSDGKVFRDGDHWVMFYFGVGRGGAHIMAAFSRDLEQWTAHPEPLYRAGGHPGGLDSQYAHKISLVYKPENDTYYMHYCAVGNQGRGIGLITSKPLP